MVGDQISCKTLVSTHTQLSAVQHVLSPAIAGQQTWLMLFLAPELHVSVRKPLNANRGDCPLLNNACVCVCVQNQEP